MDHQWGGGRPSPPPWLRLWSVISFNITLWQNTITKYDNLMDRMEDRAVDWADNIPDRTL